MYDSASFPADPVRARGQGRVTAHNKMLLLLASAGAAEIQSASFDRLKRELDGWCHFQSNGGLAVLVRTMYNVSMMC